MIEKFWHPEVTTGYDCPKSSDQISVDTPDEEHLGADVKCSECGVPYIHIVHASTTSVTYSVVE